jgi:hypothetical protein
MTSSPDEDIVNTSQIAAGVYRSLANAILDPSGALPGLAVDESTVAIPDLVCDLDRWDDLSVEGNGRTSAGEPKREADQGIAWTQRVRLFRRIGSFVLVGGFLTQLVPLGTRVGPGGLTYECGSVLRPSEGGDVWGMCDGAFFAGNLVGIATFVVGIIFFAKASRLKRQNTP